MILKTIDTLCRVTLILASVIVLIPHADAEDLRLPAIFSDHAVLQRNAPIAIWGWGVLGKRTVWLLLKHGHCPLRKSGFV